MGPFAIDLSLLFWAVVTFACLLFLLTKFAFKPLSHLLEERERTITDSLEKARKASDEAQKVLAQNEARLDEAREETRKIINEGHKIVANMKRESHEAAKQEANVIVNQARVEIDREFQKGLDDLKGTVSGLSVRIARQVIQSEIDEKKHKELADEFIERLKKSHAKRQS